uniref:GTP cyclohydrolase I n=1 Tax=Leifsonia poae TaxID=110933 RepID=UPI0035A99B81
MTGFDRSRIEAAVAEILAAIGEDPSRAGLETTPGRVADAYEEFFAGLGKDPLAELGEPVPSKATTPKRCWCATSGSGRCASITCCRSSGWPMSPTCRAIG